MGCVAHELVAETCAELADCLLACLPAAVRRLLRWLAARGGRPAEEREAPADSSSKAGADASAPAVAAPAAAAAPHAGTPSGPSKPGRVPPTLAVEDSSEGWRSRSHTAEPQRSPRGAALPLRARSLEDSARGDFQNRSRHAAADAVRRGGEDGQDVEGAKGQLSNAAAHRAVLRRAWLRWNALALVYAAWAISTWIVVTCAFPIRLLTM